MTTIFDGSLVASRPDLAITFVENHDTQRGQALESTVEEWFKPLAYGLILLRQEGKPCLFMVIIMVFLETTLSKALRGYHKNGRAQATAGLWGAG